MSTSNARQLRRNATDAESVLWRILRTTDFKFRRQQPIGPYIVDFLCFSHRLIVECDGGQHAENPANVKRDAWLALRGFRTLRFWNHDILSNQDGVIQTILNAMRWRPPHPNPRPQGERG